MTTIAYKHDSREIAYDGRTTRCDTIMSDVSEKMIDRDGVKFFLCGAVCDFEMLIQMYFGVKHELVPDANAFAADGESIYRIGCTDDGVFWKFEVDYDDAMGSGWKFALAAMDFGRDANGAVEYAATRDSNTGGKITVVKV